MPGSSLSRRQGRSVRPGRTVDSVAALADIDHDLLAVLCQHRVLTQNQLHRLFPHVPERTLCYRTRRLHDLGLTGRSRPYRDHGSAPNHHWPTRRADCLMRGDAPPRGGERKAPNPLFVAHGAALSELYVALHTEAHSTGLTLASYLREGEAREPFKDATRDSALAPDATIAFRDEQGREFTAFVEIDLGSMSHTRLRQKAELYAAYTTAEAWKGRHLFLPALLFLTTSDLRAERFLAALNKALAYGPRSTQRRAFVAGAAGIARAPGRLLSDACLLDLDGNDGLSLTDVLAAARAPYARARANRQREAEAEEAQRRVLHDDPVAMRAHLVRHRSALNAYFDALGPTGARAIELLMASTAQPSPNEREVLRAIERHLDVELLEPRSYNLAPPGPGVMGKVELLIHDYSFDQARQVDALLSRHGEGPSLRRAHAVLRDGGLLDPLTIQQLQSRAAKDAKSRSQQHDHRAEYLAWREQAARKLARQAGPLGRLTHRPEAYYTQLDTEKLRVCRTCAEVIYPSAQEAEGHGSPEAAACHYCHEPHNSIPFKPAAIAATESEPYR
jgi:hypothetical protein